MSTTRENKLGGTQRMCLPVGEWFRNPEPSVRSRKHAGINQLSTSQMWALQQCLLNIRFISCLSGLCLYQEQVHSLITLKRKQAAYTSHICLTSAPFLLCQS